MANCIICAEFDDCPWRAEPNAMCSRYRQRKMTNADRIRSMTDEELEDFLDRWGLGDIDYSKTFCSLCDGQFDCHECRLDWLKQEATDGQS